MQGDPLTLVAYGANFPLGELYAWPIPLTAQEVTVYPWQASRAWPDFDTDLLLPPGYDSFLKAAVALELAPYYDKEASATVQGMRAESQEQHQDGEPDHSAAGCALVRGPVQPAERQHLLRMSHARPSRFLLANRL